MQLIKKASRTQIPLSVVVLILVAAMVLVGMVACSSKGQEPFRDAPKGERNSGAANIVEMPDGFSNLATKCWDGMRYTVAYHGDGSYGSINVVADPKCGR